jgi:hypothetical protein
MLMTLNCHDCGQPVEYFLIAGRCPECHCEAKRQERNALASSLLRGGPAQRLEREVEQLMIAQFKRIQAEQAKSPSEFPET